MIDVVGQFVVRTEGACTWVTTPEGYVIHGKPTPDQGEMAQMLGYGADLDRMCLEHDPMHAELVTFLGFGTSWSLRQAAGEALSGPEQEVAGLEEDAVLAIVKFRNAVRRLRREHR